MTDIQIPRAMIEAAARKLCNLANHCCEDHWALLADDSDTRRFNRAKATAVLAAALGVCEVEEKWVVQLQPGLVLLPHRFVITTPAEQVDTEGAR